MLENLGTQVVETSTWLFAFLRIGRAGIKQRELDALGLRARNHHDRGLARS